MVLFFQWLYLLGQAFASQLPSYPLDRIREPLPDPFPIRRVLVTADTLDQFLARLPAGPVRQMPRSEFEKAVQQTARNQLDKPAELREARYKARWQPEGWQGEAELLLDSPAPHTPFRLPPWNGAIHEVTTQQGQPIQRSQDDQQNELWWLPAAGEQTLRVRWSLRIATAEPTERYEFRLPATATSAIELELPVQRQLEGRGWFGPYATTNPATRSYRVPLGLTDASAVLVTIVDQSLNPSNGRLRLQAHHRYTLAPGEVLAELKLKFEPLGGPVNEVKILLDPAWQVLSWQTESPLRLSKEQLAEGTQRLGFLAERGLPTELSLKLAAARPRFQNQGEDWTPPAIAYESARLGQYTWEVRWDATLRCLGTNLNGFTLSPARTATVANTINLSRLPLVDSIQETDDRLKDAVKSQPRFLFAERQAVYSVREEVEFVPRPNPRWKSRLKIQVEQGLLERLLIQLPPGWSLTDAEADDESTQGVLREGNELVWLKPARRGDLLSLQYELVCDQPFSGTITLPIISMPEARERDGQLRIAMEPGRAFTIEPLAGEVEDRYWSIPFRGSSPDLVFTERTTTTEPTTEENSPRSNLEWSPTEAPDATFDFDSVLYQCHLLADGRTQVRATANILAQHSGQLNLRIHPEASLESILVADRWIDRIERTDARLSFAWPVQSDQATLPLEVVYTLPPAVPWPGLEFPGTPEPTILARFDPAWARFPSLDCPAEPVPFAPGVPRIVRTSFIASCSYVVAFVVLVFAGLSARLIKLAAVWVWTMLALFVGAALLTLSQGWADALEPLAVVVFTVTVYFWAYRSGPLSDVARTVSKARSNQSVQTLIFGVGLCWLGNEARAMFLQEQPTALVLLRLGPKGEEVFVPDATWQALKNTPNTRPSTTTITAFEISGEPADASIRFTASLELHIKPQFAERRTSQIFYQLPIEGVKLIDVKLDGDPAFVETLPSSMPGTPDRYQMAIPTAAEVEKANQSTHRLVAIFQVPIRSTMFGRECSFRGPNFSGLSLRVRPPKQATNFTCPSRLGIEQRDGGFLLVSHGKASEVRFTWRDDNAPTMIPLAAKAAALWEFTETETSLMFALQPLSESVAPGSLSLEVPIGWEPADAWFRKSDDKSIDATPIRSTIWDQEQRLWKLTLPRTDLLRWTVITRLYPVQPLSKRPTLRAPRIREALRTDLLLGLRTDYWTIDEVERFKTIDYPSDELQRSFGIVPELRLDPGNIARVFSALESNGEIRPLLARQPDQFTLDCEHRWAWHNQQWQLECQAELTMPRPTEYLQINLPEALTVYDLQAANLDGWSQKDQLLQLRFRNPEPTNTIIIRARLNGRDLTEDRTEISLPIVRAQAGAITAKVWLPLGWIAYSNKASQNELLSPENLTTLDPNDASWKLTIQRSTPPEVLAVRGEISRSGTNIRYTAEAQLRLPKEAASRFYFALIPSSLAPAKITSASINPKWISPTEVCPTGVRQLISIPADRIDDRIFIRFEQLGQAYEGNSFSLAEARIQTEHGEQLWNQRSLDIPPEFTLKSGPPNRNKQELPTCTRWTTNQNGTWTLMPDSSAPTKPTVAPSTPPSNPTKSPTLTAPDLFSILAGLAAWFFVAIFGLIYPRHAAILAAVVAASQLAPTSPAGLWFLMLAALLIARALAVVLIRSRWWGQLLRNPN